jgi:hypothetical protein
VAHRFEEKLEGDPFHSSGFITAFSHVTVQQQGAFTLTGRILKCLSLPKEVLGTRFTAEWGVWWTQSVQHPLGVQRRKKGGGCTIFSTNLFFFDGRCSRWLQKTRLLRSLASAKTLILSLSLQTANRDVGKNLESRAYQRAARVPSDTPPPQKGCLFDDSKEIGH